MSDSQWFEIQPAYGRDYKSAKAANADWLAGLDFKDSTTGQYLSIRDFPKEGKLNVIIRYGKLMKVTNAAQPSRMTTSELTDSQLEDMGIDPKPVALSGEFKVPGEEIPRETPHEFSTDSEVSAAMADLDELLAPVGWELPVANRIRVVHECKDAAFLLSVIDNTTELIGEDGKLYSFEEFEGAVIQDSYELFPVHTIDCDDCNALRLVWMRHQFVKASDSIHLAKRGLNVIQRGVLENLRLAIQYELEISRDMDGK